MSFSLIKPLSREILYYTKWEDFVINTEYDRLLDLFITKVREQGKPEVICWFCTDQWKKMQAQHQKGLFLCWEMIWLSKGSDDF